MTDTVLKLSGRAPARPGFPAGLEAAAKWLGPTKRRVAGMRARSRFDWRGGATLLVLAALWEGWCHAGASPTFAAPLEQVWTTFLGLASGGGLAGAVTASLGRVLLGFGIGGTLGLVLGCAVGLLPWLDRLVTPNVVLLRQVPIFGLAPLLTLWLGTGDPASVALIAVSAGFPVLMHTHDGLAIAPRAYREVASVLMFDRRQVLRRVLLPHAMPSVLTGFKHALAFAWIAGIGSELLTASTSGIGNLLAAGRAQLRMDLVLIGIGLVGAIGYAMTASLALLERRVLRWRA